jgi:hypothetical protein
MTLGMIRFRDIYGTLETHRETEDEPIQCEN